MIDWSRWKTVALVGAGVMVGLGLTAFLIAPRGPADIGQGIEVGSNTGTAAGARPDGKDESVRPGTMAEPNIDRQSRGNEVFIKTPPQTRLISSKSSQKGSVRESVLKLESLLSPTELQVYYTDLLVKDWSVTRDDLTEGVGWSGVFMQVEPAERTIGVFAVVKRIGPPSGASNPTAISILKAEER